MNGYTTTSDLPADVQELYELSAPLQGGPVFDLPSVRQYGIDFSKLTLHQAEVLVARKWRGIRRKEQPPAPERGDDTLETTAQTTRTRSRKQEDSENE